MKLKKILEDLNIIQMTGFKNYNIKTITHISSDITKDSIFICIKGNNFDGNKYIDEAIEKGAKCIVTESCSVLRKDICVVVVADIRIAMSVMAKNFYNRCVDNMRIIGVVGTSGKTSTSIIISQLLSYGDSNIGVIGTNGIYIGNIRQENKFTTPDPLDLHYIFYQMKMLGVKMVIMEVSAQAIYYKKVYGIKFDICVFTNISREHLDFFGSFENYAKVKMDFFSSKNMKECVVCTDDFYGRELAFKVNTPCVSYGIKEPANSFAIDIEYGFAGTRFVANIIDDIIEVSSSFVGEYNVYNIIASLTVVKLLGYDKTYLEKSISCLKSIDGRYNLYEINNKQIIIDFAHTPDSIDKLLSHISQYASKKIVSVFGCVGYSDKDKRFEMATMVARYSTKVYVTSDNPGKTPFDEIAKDIVDGLNGVEYECIEDRLQAIRRAYDCLLDDEILVIMGKGAEDFQKIGDDRVPYSDKDCVLGLMECHDEARFN